MSLYNIKLGRCAKCGEKLSMGLLDVVYCCPSCPFSIKRTLYERMTFVKHVAGLHYDATPATHLEVDLDFSSEVE